jgi:[acyl-carrier-protein] S-malonyltransferase
MNNTPKAYVCPGQGSQFIGMGKDLFDAYPEARLVFEEVDDALAQKLSQLMFHGAEADLNLTENTQPALMAVSVAIARVLEKHLGADFLNPQSVKCLAGHSLGEYSALTIAGTFTVADCARLLKTRGQAMQKAVPVGVGAMAAILGLEMPEVTALAQEASVKDDLCAAANDNSYGQVVISGHKAAVERACALATAKGAKRALLLPVSAPFHCALMQPAADVMADALAKVEMRAPRLPVLTNVTADVTTDPVLIRDLLVKQVTGMVRWRESVHQMKTLGVAEVVEIGAGKVLSGLIKRIEKDIQTQAIGTTADVDTYLNKA